FPRHLPQDAWPRKRWRSCFPALKYPFSQQKAAPSLSFYGQKKGRLFYPKGQFCLTVGKLYIRQAVLRGASFNEVFPVGITFFGVFELFCQQTAQLLNALGILRIVDGVMGFIRVF